MPLSTDSGYLPDWLLALLGQGGVSPPGGYGPNAQTWQQGILGDGGGVQPPIGGQLNGPPNLPIVSEGRSSSSQPIGLFSDTAASPAPNVGLLSNSPLFSYVNSNAPAFQEGNAPRGPLPDKPPEFTYMNQNSAAFQNGPPGVQGYPSMTMPQDPGPMNIGPTGAAPLFSNVNPGAQAFQNGPDQVQGPADVPLPPRRPTDLRDFQATTSGPTNLAPPNSNVQGTPMSGAPEAVAPSAQPKSPGLGDYLGKASDLIGSIYGAGGPGDALIALGLSNRTNGASIQALNSMNANRASQANVALKQLDYTNKLKSANSSYNYLKQQGVDEGTARAAVDAASAGNTEPLKTLFQQYSGNDQWTIHNGPDGNAFAVHKFDPSRVVPVGPQTGSSQLTDIPIGKDSEGQDQFVKGWVQKGQPLSTAVPIGSPFTKQPQVVMQQEGALQKGLGEAKSSVVGDAIRGGETAQKRIDAVNLIDEATKAGGGNITSGPGAEKILSAKEALGSALGFDPKGMVPSEVISKLAYPLGAELSRTINSRGGTQAEFMRGLQSVPSLLVSNTGRTFLTSIVRQQAQQDQQLSVLADKWNPKTDGPWSEVKSKFYEDHPLISPFTNKPVGQSDIEIANGGTDQGGQTPTEQPKNARPFRIIGQ